MAQSQEVCRFFLKDSCTKVPCHYRHDAATSQNYQRDFRKFNVNSKKVEEREVCQFYLKGKCTKVPCRFRHDIERQAPTCRYYEQNMCYNENCPYSHDTVKPIEDKPPSWSAEGLAMAKKKENGGMLKQASTSAAQGYTSVFFGAASPYSDLPQGCKYCALMKRPLAHADCIVLHYKFTQL